MAADFDMDVIFRCMYAECGEFFEKSLDDLAGFDKVFCPRCSTPVTIAGETQLLASTGAAARLSMTKATG